MNCVSVKVKVCTLPGWLVSSVPSSFTSTTWSLGWYLWRDWRTTIWRSEPKVHIRNSPSNFRRLTTKINSFSLYGDGRCAANQNCEPLLTKYRTKTHNMSLLHYNKISHRSGMHYLSRVVGGTFVVRELKFSKWYFLAHPVRTGIWWVRVHINPVP